MGFSGYVRTIGAISGEEVAKISDGRLQQGVEVTVNKLVYDYDQAIIFGPVFPHEVVGFSGGNKFFFPGVSGPEVINLTHWLGALITNFHVIGTKHTPVRAIIDRAAGMVGMPKLCLALW